MSRYFLGIAAIFGGLAALSLWLAAALNFEGSLARVLSIVCVGSGFLGAGAIFFAGFFGLGALLARFGILPPSQPASSEYWRGYNDGWDDKQY